MPEKQVPPIQRRQDKGARPMGKILECREICKDYGQGRLVTPVLRNINFSMESGEYVAVMGPSG